MNVFRPNSKMPRFTPHRSQFIFCILLSFCLYLSRGEVDVSKLPAPAA
jgi:hypothetical protein